MSENPAPRRERAKWKVTLQWIVGCVTDPHTKVSSAARIVGILTAIATCAYVLGCVLTHQKADPWVIGELNVVTIAALKLRSRSTQEGKLPSTARASDRIPAPPLEPHEVA